MVLATEDAGAPVLLRLALTSTGDGSIARPRLLNTNGDEWFYYLYVLRWRVALTVTGISDSTEPYSWSPINSAEVVAFANHVAGLTDRSLTVTFNDNAAAAPATPAAPTLSVNSSTSITATGTAPDDGGSAITSYDWRHKRTADAAWIDRFDETSLSQTFTGLDSATEYEFQFRATNDEGDSDYSLSATATTATATVAPAFADGTGDAQSWTQNTAITSITVPEATGTPTPTYAAVGALPAGIAFNTSTRVISGTPTAVGSGTITIPSYQLRWR